MARTPQKATVGVAASTHESAAPCAEAVERNGGEPWIVLPEHDPPPEDALTRMGGLLLCGDGDVDSSPLTGDLEAGANPKIHDGRDAGGLRLINAALDADIPVLCVGAGMQTLNVAMGGSPARKVTGHGASEGNGESVSSYHRIYISPGSKLAAVVGSGGFVRVNSRHHRGSREAQKSPLLLASAYSLEDGVIEGLESPNHRWVIGVQFHPERRHEMPPHFERLFQSLVERAGEHMNTRK